MAKKIYDSAGVYTSEKDLTYTTETIGVTTLGLVGETVKGPAFQPMFIRNYDEFKVTFGGTNPEKFKNTQIVKYELPYIAKSYLSQSNQLFVTRVLGLSGYNAGNAIAIRTLGSVNQASLVGVENDAVVPFTFDAATGIFTVSGTSDDLGEHIATVIGLDEIRVTNALDTFLVTTNYQDQGWFDNSDLMYWGIVDYTILEDITDITKGDISDEYDLPSTIPTSDRDNYVFNNEFIFNEATDMYDSVGYCLYMSGITAYTGTTFTGNTIIKYFTYTCVPNLDFHKKTVAVLRSRAQYISDEISWMVPDANTVLMSNIENVTKNPYATFNIVGIGINGAFDYSVSLDATKKNYIKNVLGTTQSDKDLELFVEESYYYSIKYGWENGLIKGLHSTVIPLNTWGNYKSKFTSPVTPFFVSEIRGDVPERLFRLISISDGDTANTEIKVSIANVNLSSKTFDIIIRAFNDSDKNPVFLERFLGVTMDERQDNYIGRKIGTIDGKYPLKSSYVIAEMAENAPANSVVAGFEGYEFKTNIPATGTTGTTESTYCGVPEIPYKVKYYKPSDYITNPAYGTPLVSYGEKIRKVYLGFSDAQYGIDADLLKYKGKQGGEWDTGAEWFVRTKGFHLDINAADIEDNFGNKVFAAGIGSFTDPADLTSKSHPYYDILTRKFTALFAGGFDGWDIYRENRTNGDNYMIGRDGFIAGGFDEFQATEYSNETFGTSDYYATFYGVKTFGNPEQVVINILATPGIDLLNNTDLVEETIEMVEEKRFDCIYLPTLPDIKMLDNNNPSNSDNWLYPEDIALELENTEIDSNYTAVYYPWIQVNDLENNAHLFIPPTAEVIRNLAFTDNVAHPWFATAGYDRGLVNCIRTRFALDQEKRDTLYVSRINPLATFSDVGVTIWGNRNLQIKDSALNRLNIRRLILQARKLIVSVANRLLFNPNDDQIRNQFLSLVNPILDNIRKERGLVDFRVSLVNQTEDGDRNTMTGRIYLKPTPSLEFIELEFSLTDTNVSFDDI